MKLKSTFRSLTPGARKFIELQTLFSGFSAVLSLFINTYLLNSFGSYSREVLFYNVILALVQPAAMITALFLTKARHALYTQRVGFIFYGLAMTLLCVFGERVSNFYPLFTVMLSFGAGYYYTTYSSQILCYTMDGNRDLIAGITSLLGSAISILLPLISGVLIDRFGKTTGYRVVFGIAALLSVGALITNLRLPKIPKHDKKPALRLVASAILRSPNGRRIMLANALSNCRGFTLPIFVTLLFYNLMPNELMISVNSTIGYCVALLGAAVYGACVKSSNRVRVSILAAIAVLLPAIGMLFGMNVVIIMVFNAVNGFFGTFYSTPVLNTHFRVVEDLRLGGEYGGEIHTFREIFVTAGRILGLTIVWSVPKTSVGAVIVVLFMTLTALGDAALLRGIERSETRMNTVSKH